MKPFNSFLGLTSDEIHAFAIGFFEVLCPGTGNFYIPSAKLPYIEKEYHYYLAGRGLGFITVLAILLVLAKIIKEWII